MPNTAHLLHLSSVPQKWQNCYSKEHTACFCVRPAAELVQKESVRSSDFGVHDYGSRWWGCRCCRRFSAQSGSTWSGHFPALYVFDSDWRSTAEHLLACSNILHREKIYFYSCQSSQVTASYTAIQTHPEEHTVITITILLLRKIFKEKLNRHRSDDILNLLTLSASDDRLFIFV